MFDLTGRNPLIDIAMELERIALEDDYFVSRKLYPNVDFYSGIIYQALGFPVEMFPVLFAIPRTAGWIAQWREMITDPEQKIARPRQIYTGERTRKYVPMTKRARTRCEARRGLSQSPRRPPRTDALRLGKDRLAHADLVADPAPGERRHRAAA